MKKSENSFTTIIAKVIAVGLSPLIFVVIVLGCAGTLLWDLLARPYRKAKYKKSYFYNDFGEKYSTWLYQSGFYFIYNTIKEKNLPLTTFRCLDRKGKTDTILFFYGKTLLYANTKEDIGCNADSSNWIVEVINEKSGNEETVDFIHYINKEINRILSKHPDCPRPDRRVILIREKHIAKKDRIRAIEIPVFLVYNKDNIAEMISKFITES